VESVAQALFWQASDSNRIHRTDPVSQDAAVAGQLSL
jgi:hypothetical protein